MPVWSEQQGSAGFSDADENCIEIGLVNNMPGAAVANTERQFRRLLGAAADGISVRLILLSLPGVPRTDLARRLVNSFYVDVTHVRDRRFDGLIVTGTEPRTENLREEPYWTSLTGLLEWAESQTYSSVWSCLAAHAAVLHRDAIARQRLPEKRFGVFECARVSDHQLTHRLPGCVNIPHSRWNDIGERALTEAGYGILTRSQDAGVDAFVRQGKNLSVFFQGHPEYDPDTLLLEYRRDVGRFLRGERESYPAMPHRYFDDDTRSALAALQARAATDRSEDTLRDLRNRVPSRGPQNSWSAAAVVIYRNWLRFLCEQKSQWLRKRRRLEYVSTAGAGAAPNYV